MRFSRPFKDERSIKERRVLTEINKFISSWINTAEKSEKSLKVRQISRARPALEGKKKIDEILMSILFIAALPAERDRRDNSSTPFKCINIPRESQTLFFSFFFIVNYIRAHLHSQQGVAAGTPYLLSSFIGFSRYDMVVPINSAQRPSLFFTCERQHCTVGSSYEASQVFWIKSAFDYGMSQVFFLSPLFKYLCYILCRPMAHINKYMYRKSWSF